MGCCSSTPKEQANTIEHLQHLGMTTTHDTGEAKTLQNQHVQRNGYLEFIAVILAKYNIVINQRDLQKIFDQYRYDGQHLVDEIRDIFDKGRDDDTLLSHILQYELKCEQKNERNSIYDEILYECVRKEMLNNPKLIRILQIISSKLIKTSPLNEALFNIYSPKFIDLDQEIQQKFDFIITRLVSSRNKIIRSNQRCTLVANDIFVIKCNEYQEILNYAQKELCKALILNKREKNTEIVECIENDDYKTATDLLAECTNCRVNERNANIDSCESIKRIIIILMIYQKLMNSDKLWRRISLIPILTFGNIYTLTQIINDFDHIKDHIDECEELRNELNEKLQQQFECRRLAKCNGYGLRRYRSRYKYPKTLNNEEIVFQELMDSIHSYMIHASSQSGADGVDTGTISANPGKQENGNNDKKESGKTYIGEKEDNEWWNKIDDDESKENDEMDDIDDEMKRKTDEDEYMYRQLVENMGIFRWQSIHGFTSTQHEGLMHLKPRYKNVKDEALQNPYYRLSVDNWNQTLRKAKVFFTSFNRKRIQTDYKGKYDDTITGKRSKWKKKQGIDMKEIVTLKLYTDFDKLQYELKKCFRFETISDIFTLKNFDPDDLGKNKYAFDPNAKENRFKLEERLQVFYWWRIDLITVLNKFGKKLNHNQIKLYHGVNAKMILNNGGTQRLGFYGPLSTSASYHVARTFATAKGMVLEVTTQYPQLGVCRAFDARWISDYPEEKEWLIGFVYLRILKVLTRPLNKNWKEFDDIDKPENYYKIPIASETRSIFFAIHLFRQQVFWMSVHLEYWLSSFLYLQCKYNDENLKTDFVEKLQTVVIDKNAKLDEDKNKENDEKEEIKHYRILSILWEKLYNFRRFPNGNQVVRIDQISHNLRPFFMDRIDDKYIISFSKIIRIFENAREIHFVNNPLDNIILDKLLKYFDKNPTSTLRKIKFLYYDEDEQPTPNLDYLDSTLWNELKEKKWDIKGKYIGKKEKRTGYEVRIFQKN